MSPSPSSHGVLKHLAETEHNIEAGGYRKGPTGFAAHSSKLTKAQRRERRKANLHFHQRIFQVLNKRSLFLKGQEKIKILVSQAEDPVYDRPQRAERNGIKRHQKRVRGRLQPLNQKQRGRVALVG